MALAEPHFEAESLNELKANAILQLDVGGNDALRTVCEQVRLIRNKQRSLAQEMERSRGWFGVNKDRWDRAQDRYNDLTDELVFLGRIAGLLDQQLKDKEEQRRQDDEDTSSSIRTYFDPGSSVDRRIIGTKDALYLHELSGIIKKSLDAGHLHLSRNSIDNASFHFKIAGRDYDKFLSILPGNHHRIGSNANWFRNAAEGFLFDGLRLRFFNMSRYLAKGGYEDFPTEDFMEHSVGPLMNDLRNKPSRDDCLTNWEDGHEDRMHIFGATLNDVIRNPHLHFEDLWNERFFSLPAKPEPPTVYDEQTDETQEYLRESQPWWEALNRVLCREIDENEIWRLKYVLGESDASLSHDFFLQGSKISTLIRHDWEVEWNAGMRVSNNEEDPKVEAFVLRYASIDAEYGTHEPIQVGLDRAKRALLDDAERLFGQE